MKNKKPYLVGVIVLILLLSTSSSFASTTINTQNRGPELKITTDKDSYKIGEFVTVYFTNIGDEILSGGGPTVTIYNDEEEIVYQEGMYCWWEIEPGEYEEWAPWDQTDQQGVQVPVGEYTVEGFLSGQEENYVDTASFYITENGAPSNPIITGPSKVMVGTLHEWTVISTDPEGSDITYYWDWGDQCGASWYGPYPSGEVIVMPHIYTYASTYIINAVAMDDESKESDWVYFDIEVVKSRIVNSPFLRFLESYPILLRMLCKILG